jgi:hypothetical protein
MSRREGIYFVPQYHKHLYQEYHSVCPLVGTPLPHPLSCKRVCFPPEPGGVHIPLRVRGWGCPNTDDWKKSLVGTLSTLCPVQILPVTAQDS